MTIRIGTLIAISFGVAFLAISAEGQDLAIPPSAQTAEQALKDSPRHREYVDIEVPSLNTKIRTFVTFPERADKAPVVIVIHEIFGLTPWIESIADHLAGQGFIAVAPDLIYDKPGDDPATAKVRALPEGEVVAKLNAVRDYALKQPSANGKSASIGFCWGGGASFLYATAQPGLNAAVVCYGTSPDTAKLKDASAAVLGLYGEADARVNATIAPAAEEMKRLGKVFEHEIYTNAGHGFFRQQDGREGANLEATKKGWARAVEFLRKYTENRAG